jgi:hypothetical protein
VPDEYAAIVAKNNAKAAEDDSDVEFIDPTIPPGRDGRCLISVAMLSELRGEEAAVKVIDDRGNELMVVREVKV